MHPDWLMVLILCSAQVTLAVSLVAWKVWGVLTLVERRLKREEVEANTTAPVKKRRGF